MSMVVGLMEYAIDARLQLYRINLSFYDIREVFLIAADRTWAVDIIGLDGCKLDEAQDITEQDKHEGYQQETGYWGGDDEQDEASVCMEDGEGPVQCIHIIHEVAAGLDELFAPVF